MFPVRKAFPPLACLHEQFDQRSIDLVVNACTAGFHEPHGHARSLHTNLAVERKLCLVMFAQRVRENSRSWSAATVSAIPSVLGSELIDLAYFGRG